MKHQSFHTSPLDLACLRNYVSKRESSYDRKGGNNDAHRINPGDTITIAQVEGAGIITHLWFTVHHLDYFWPRRLVLRCYWDGAEYPSVEVPLGDFFGVGHGLVNYYSSLMLNMVGNRKEHPNQAALNSFFQMPFQNGARLTITNESSLRCLAFYCYVDYQVHKTLPEGLGRFHAQYRQECPAGGIKAEETYVHELINIPNLDGSGNYVMLDTKGRGHYVGCTLSIDNWDLSVPTYWFGEGDDMIFIDGETWPPSLHGTGTEDYFCAAWGYPAGEHSLPFHGVSYKEPNMPDYAGKWSQYRHHIFDPITFTKSIRVTIEHGHANVSNADYSSVAYYYLDRVCAEPLPGLPESDLRIARFFTPHAEIAYKRYLYLFGELQRMHELGKTRKPDFDIFGHIGPEVHDVIWSIIRLYHEGKYYETSQQADKALHLLRRMEGDIAVM